MAPYIKTTDVATAGEAVGITHRLHYVVICWFVHTVGLLLNIKDEPVCGLVCWGGVFLSEHSHSKNEPGGMMHEILFISQVRGLSGVNTVESQAQSGFRFPGLDGELNQGFGFLTFVNITQIESYLFFLYFQGQGGRCD